MQEPTLIRPTLVTQTKHSRPATTLSSLSALSTIDTTFYARSPPSSRYSAHHSASIPPTEVIPRLFLADVSAAECLSTLTSLGITHILSAMPGFVSIPPHLSPSHHLQLPIQDNPFAELAAHLPQTTAFIAQALSSPHNRVLVHCAQGISRSTSVVAAYLVATGMTPNEAVSYIKSKRTHADPNPGFVSQLGEYADSLRRSGGGNVVVAPSSQQQIFQRQHQHPSPHLSHLHSSHSTLSTSSSSSSSQRPQLHLNPHTTHHTSSSWGHGANRR